MRGRDAERAVQSEAPEELETSGAPQLLREAVQWIEKNGQEKLAEGAELKEPLPWSVRLDLQLLGRDAEELLAKKSGQ